MVRNLWFSSKIESSAKQINLKQQCTIYTINAASIQAKTLYSSLRSHSPNSWNSCKTSFINVNKQLTSSKYHIADEVEKEIIVDRHMGL